MVQFSELDWELAPECGMTGSGGGSGGGSSGGSGGDSSGGSGSGSSGSGGGRGGSSRGSDTRMLSPMITNATVFITIRDNDAAKESIAVLS